MSVVRRLDRSMGANTSSVPILSRVFGLETSETVPVLMVYPSKQARDAFTKEFSTQKKPKDKLFVHPGNVIPADLVDGFETKLPNTEDITEPVSLFFVDRNPRANWAHACLYVLHLPDQTWRYIPHSWPPPDRINLLPLDE